MKFEWLRITLPVYSVIRLNDFIADTCTKATGSLRRATSYRRERLTRFWLTYSGRPRRRREKARMLPCLYFQLSWWMVLEVKASTLLWYCDESSSKIASSALDAASLTPFSSYSSLSTSHKFCSSPSTSRSAKGPEMNLCWFGFSSIFFSCLASVAQKSMARMQLLSSLGFLSMGSMMVANPST